MHQPLSLLSFKALFSFKLKGDFLSLEILYTGDLKNGLNHTWGFLILEKVYELLVCWSLGDGLSFV